MSRKNRFLHPRAVAMLTFIVAFSATIKEAGASIAGEQDNLRRDSEANMDDVTFSLHSADRS